MKDVPSDVKDIMGGFLPSPSPIQQTLNTSDAGFNERVDDILAAERRNRLRVGALVLVVARKTGLVTESNAAALIRLLEGLSSDLHTVEVKIDHRHISDPPMGDDVRFWRVIVQRMSRLRALHVAQSEFIDCDDHTLQEIANAITAAPMLTELSIAPHGPIVPAVCALRDVRLHLVIKQDADFNLNGPVRMAWDGQAPQAKHLWLEALQPVQLRWDHMRVQQLRIDPLYFHDILPTEPIAAGRSLELIIKKTPDGTMWKKLRNLMGCFRSSTVSINPYTKMPWHILQMMTASFEELKYLKSNSYNRVPPRIHVRFDASGITSDVDLFMCACELAFRHYLDIEDRRGILSLNYELTTFGFHSVHPSLYDALSGSIADEGRFGTVGYMLKFHKLQLEKIR
jgi:hypothetical protein